MGVTKAAADAEALARHLTAGTVTQALAAYGTERHAAAALAHATAQRLGRYIFAGPGQGSNHDGRNNPNLARIMAETAVVPAAPDYPVT
jgi:hypothetical protein